MPLIKHRYNFAGRAGCVDLRRSRQTGTEIGIYSAEQAGLDESGGPWVTICEKHGTLINHQSLKLAKLHRSDPQGWCEDCR